ncbi:MAG: basic amino acid/polyamine antiporter, family [Candidatus Dependentiae bacterium]|nr:basic amino acid/polyamine antiporter, family [Candidatus Dependentiae bacterium]
MFLLATSQSHVYTPALFTGHTTTLERFYLMSTSTRALGFWPVFALVTGSQIGSGVFMLPSLLAPYGPYALAGWFFSGIGAIMLALVFARLCEAFPETGGPHIYVEKAFGRTASFFVGWTYWIVSWVSTTVVCAACVGYVLPLLKITHPLVIFALQASLTIIVTALNLRSAQSIGTIESFLTLLKFIPLIIIPGVIIPRFSLQNIVLSPTIAALPTGDIISQVTLLTLWCFVGLEAATTPAGMIKNPQRTIPLAIVTGTAATAALYVFNSLSVMGALPAGQLAGSITPYVDAVQAIFGGNWYLAISVISALVCLSTINAWTLTSSQIALGLAQKDLLPAAFKKQTANGAPIWALAVSCFGTLPILGLLSSHSLAQQVTTIIDYSVTAFLFVYLACCAAFFHFLYRKKSGFDSSWLIGIGATGFCCWVIVNTTLNTVLIATLFTLSGLPMYLYHRRS